jgi:hypothetical protein
MIVVKLFGGLGNQLFQYAFGKKLSLQTNQKLYLEIEAGFKNDPYQRNYNLSPFNVHENLLKNDPISMDMYHLSTDKKHGRGKIKNYLLGFKRHNWQLITEKNLEYDLTIEAIKKHTYLEGFWQSENYFKDVREEILQDFQLKASLKNDNALISKKMSDVVSVSLHIRRMHGVKLPGQQHHKIHGGLDLAYYQKAIDIIAAQHPNLELFVFSDDIEWAKENFKSRFPVEFMSQNDDAHNYLDLVLMSQCKHQIIANSTFSWWGAWLNQNPEKIVIAPKIWFVDQKMNVQTRDLIPSDWIRI